MRWCWLGRFYPTYYFWILILSFFGFLTLSFFWIFYFIIFLDFWLYHFFGFFIFDFFWIFDFIIFWIFDFWFFGFFILWEMKNPLGSWETGDLMVGKPWQFGPLCILESEDTVSLPWHLTAPRHRPLPLASNVYGAGRGWKESPCPTLRCWLKIWSLNPS